MNAMIFLFIVAVMIYSALYDATLMKIYFILLLVYYLSTQLFATNRYNNNRRKAMIGSWSEPNEPNIYLPMDIDLTKTERYLQKLNETSKQNITITHLIGKAAGAALTNEPSFNGRICFGNLVWQIPIQYYPKKEIGVSFLVALDEGKDLAAAGIQNIDSKSIEEISIELQQAASKVRAHKDKLHKKRSAPPLLPTFMIGPLTDILCYITQRIGIPLPMFGMDKFPFGSCLVTNVGAMGYKQVFGPITPFTNVPLVLFVGSKHQKALVVDNKVVAREVLPIVITADHRYADGSSASHIYTSYFMENPESLENAMELKMDWKNVRTHIEARSTSASTDEGKESQGFKEE